MRGYCIPPANIWDWKIISQIAQTGVKLTERAKVDVLTANHGILLRPYYFKYMGPAIKDDSPESAYYMDDIWINGILAINNVTKYVIPAAADPTHRKVVQVATNTLENVPAGRAYHNNILMTHFEDHWSNCPLPADAEVASYYMRYTAPSKKHLNPPRELPKFEWNTERLDTVAKAHQADKDAAAAGDGAGVGGRKGGALLAALQSIQAEAVKELTQGTAGTSGSAGEVSDATVDEVFQRTLSRLAAAKSGDSTGSGGALGAVVDKASIASLFAERKKLREAMAARQAAAATGNAAASDYSSSSSSTAGSSTGSASGSAKSGSGSFGDTQSILAAIKGSTKDTSSQLPPSPPAYVPPSTATNTASKYASGYGSDNYGAGSVKSILNSASANKKDGDEGAVWFGPRPTAGRAGSSSDKDKADKESSEKKTSPGGGYDYGGGDYAYYMRRVTKGINLKDLAAQFDGTARPPTDAELAAMIKKEKEAEEKALEREREREREMFAAEREARLKTRLEREQADADKDKHGDQDRSLSQGHSARERESAREESEAAVAKAKRSDSLEKWFSERGVHLPMKPATGAAGVGASTGLYDGYRSDKISASALLSSTAPPTLLSKSSNGNSESNGNSKPSASSTEGGAGGDRKISLKNGGEVSLEEVLAALQQMRKK